MDFKDEINKSGPINIKNFEFKQYDISNNIRNSLVLYNKSIANIKFNHIDIAIVDLKKSVASNSSFCEAIKLLGLCYAYKSNYSRAEKYFKKLADYPMYYEIANAYLEAVNSEKATLKALEAIRGANSKFSKITNLFTFRNRTIGKQRQRVKAENNFKKKMAFFILIPIIVLTAAALFYKLKPNFKIPTKLLIHTEEKETSQVLAVNEEKVIEINEKYTQLDENYKSLEKNLENTKSELDAYKNKYNVILQLSEADKHYKNKEYDKVANILLELKKLPIEDSSKANFEKLWNDIKTNAIWTIYKQANDLYKQKNYKEALPKFLISQQFITDPELLPWIIHQIGLCYKEINDNENALYYFEKVKKEYSTTKYAGYSELIINQIKNK
jgi:tetratricopeptide (TPR) repeat protein